MYKSRDSCLGLAWHSMVVEASLFCTAILGKVAFILLPRMTTWAPAITSKFQLAGRRKEEGGRRICLISVRTFPLRTDCLYIVQNCIRMAKYSAKNQCLLWKKERRWDKPEASGTVSESLLWPRKFSEHKKSYVILPWGNLIYGHPFTKCFLNTY